MSGADLHLVSGLINDAGREAAAAAGEHGWFDVSTLKEPYRLEGKKIMGYELALAFNWQLPDVIVYPTGGGTGLVGMWKAFEEMEALGWIDDIASFWPTGWDTDKDGESLTSLGNIDTSFIA